MKTNAVPFGETALGAGLELISTDTIVQTKLSVDAHRMARSQFGFGSSTGAATVEFYLYSPNGNTPSLAPSAGVPPLCMGWVTALASLSKYVGEDAEGVSYCPGDGKIRINGAVVATFATAALNDFVNSTVDKTSKVITFAKNGTVIGTVDISSFGDVAWYYAATVSGNPGDLAIWANAGQTPLRTPGSGGFFHLGQGLVPLYIASEPYICAANDSLPNQKYQGLITRTQGPPSVPMAVKFWMWGNSAPRELGSGGQVQIQIQDPNHLCDDLMSENIRDQILQFHTVAQGQPFSTATPVVTCVIDHCEQPTDQTKTLYCNDKLTLLQSQLVRPLFAPNADPSVASKPYPYTNGIGRTYVGAQFDSANLYQQLSCTPIAAFGKVRRQGVELAYGIDFTIRGDAASVTLTEKPVGKVTFETTSFGGSFNASSTDLLGGSGDFTTATNEGGGVTASSSSTVTIGTGAKSFAVLTGLHFVTGSRIRATHIASGDYMDGVVTSYSGTTLTIGVSTTSGSGSHSLWSISGGVNQPTNWQGSGGYFSPDPPDTVWQIRTSGGHQYVEQAQTADTVYPFASDIMTVAPGASVAYEIAMRLAPYYGPGVDALGSPITIPPAYLVFGGMASANIQFYAWKAFQIPGPQFYHGGAAPAVVAYRGSFTNTQANTLPLVLALICNNFIQGTGGINSYLRIDSIKVVALPSLTQNVTLDGPGLDLMLQDLMIAHGPFEDSDYDSTGAAAIDAATGWKYGIHVSPDETPMVQECCRRLLVAPAADMYVGASGKAHVVRQFKPEDVTDADLAGEFAANDVIGFLRVYPDLAEKLTTRLSGFPQPDPYTESDFANVTQDDVPQVERKLLEQKFQWTVTSKAILAPRYLYAYSALPLETQLDREVDGQAAIDYACDFYTDDRNFYVGNFPIEKGFAIGQTWKGTYPLPTLQNGQKVGVFAVIPSPTEGEVTVVFWGL